MKVDQKVKYRNIAGEEMPEVQERSEITGQNWEAAASNAQGFPSDNGWD